MSFQNKGFWMTKDNGCLPEGEIVYDNSSRIEPKRAHQWFPDPNEEAFPNKKQAIETSHRLFGAGVPGAPAGNLSLWDNASSFQPVPGHQSHQSHQTHHFTDQLFGTEPARTINFSDRSIHSIGTENLNMGRSVEEQFRNNASVALSMSPDYLGPSLYGGARKVKINQVRGSDSGTAVSMGHTYQVKEPSSGIPMSLGQIYQFKETASGVPVSMGHSYQVKEPGSGLPASMGHTFNGNQGIISFGGYHEETGYREESETGPSGRLISNYDLLMSQSSVQASEQLNEKALVVTNVENPVGSIQAPTTKTDTVPKTKTDPKVAKKVAANNNNFPSNVKSLLSTGILDGVPVKYIAWSREELRGTIKGSGYLCGCQACKFSKALNAYEFERHAGCKTKHPNNHIFFENGKTIYAIVQELRSTPQNKLFEAILTVTGSPINQKSFNLWKESYQAATRELQRIYGKDETNQSTQNVYS